jgi:hypothetical protein
MMGADAIGQLDLEGDAAEVGGAGRASEMKDRFGGGQVRREWLDYVVFDQAEAGMIGQVSDIARIPGDKVVQDQDGVPVLQERRAKM